MREVAWIIGRKPQCVAGIIRESVACVSGIVITTLAQRPALADELYAFADEVWPEFMFHDKTGNALMGQVARLFPEQCVVGTDDGELVAHGRSIPFVFPDEDRTELPDGGWDEVLVWGMRDHRLGRTPTVSSALEIQVRPSHTGRGLSYLILAALKDAVRGRGHAALYAPVRPTGKTDAGQPMSSYIAAVRADGLPIDPWLRVHVRSGATIIKVAPASMVMAGSVSQWRSWTGLPFDQDGDVHVPRALAPVRCSVTHDQAVYVEPNVWVHHDLRNASSTQG